MPITKQVRDVKPGDLLLPVGVSGFDNKCFPEWSHTVYKVIPSEGNFAIGWGSEYQSVGVQFLASTSIDPLRQTIVRYFRADELVQCVKEGKES